ncbi:MAG: hypothetical protein AB7P20_13350 [Rhizobiaceae bacterium]
MNGNNASDRDGTLNGGVDFPCFIAYFAANAAQQCAVFRFSWLQDHTRNRQT